MLEPATTSRICLLQALSPVGRCRTCDASGDGYGRGEAFTVVLLGYLPRLLASPHCLRHVDLVTWVLGCLSVNSVIA